MTSPLLSISPIYAAVLSLMLVPLAIRIIKLRWTHRVAFMDGGHDDLLRAIRTHGNFTEYVPLCLLLLVICELNQAPDWSLHLLGSILLLGRLFHAYGLRNQSLRSRQIGMTLTFVCLFGGSVGLIASLFMV